MNRSSTVVSRSSTVVSRSSRLRPALVNVEEPVFRVEEPRLDVASARRIEEERVVDLEEMLTNVPGRARHR